MNSCVFIKIICNTIRESKKKYKSPKIFIKFENGVKKVILRNLNEKFYLETFLKGKTPKLSTKVIFNSSINNRKKNLRRSTFLKDLPT